MNNLLETKECRICLIDDLKENMIYPCLCKGSNKYVHHECLKTFMILSDNELFKKECYICKYEYNYELENTNCYKCNFSLFIINIIFASFILLYILNNILSVIYSIIVSFIIILPFFINLFSVKKKYILFKLYCKEYIFIPFILLCCGISLLQYKILNIYGFYLENVSVFMIWNIHNKCIHHLNKFEHFKIVSINNV